MINRTMIKFCKPFHYSNIALYTGLLLLSMQLNAQAADALEKIHLSADHMRLNIESGYSVYTGNVKISQGKLLLTGDKVTVKQGKEEVEEITVTGKPARYRHITEKGEAINAESEQMIYTLSDNKLVMTVNAKLKQPDHQISSQKITYDTKKKIVIAGDKSTTSRTKSDSERVKITLTPKKDPQKK